MPSSSFRTTSDGTPRIVEVTGATVTVDRYAMALLRAEHESRSFFVGRLAGRGKLVEPDFASAMPRAIPRAFLAATRGLRFPTPRFRAGFRLSRVALAVALFIGSQFQGSQFQPTEMGLPARVLAWHAHRD